MCNWIEEWERREKKGNNPFESRSNVFPNQTAEPVTDEIIHSSGSCEWRESRSIKHLSVINATVIAGRQHKSISIINPLATFHAQTYEINETDHLTGTQWWKTKITDSRQREVCTDGYSGSGQFSILVIGGKRSRLAVSCSSHDAKKKDRLVRRRRRMKPWFGWRPA